MKFKITKPIRLIEFFSGMGCQNLSLKYIGANYESWKTCEWAIKSIQAYKDIHCSEKSIVYCSEMLDKDKLVDYLFNKGISNNYNEPMTRKQIERLPQEKLQQIYENILFTNNLVNIQQVKGEDLEIVDRDKFTYLLTYSFPCQDLSLAGKGQGMSDTSTRSGMLWEVERILKECKELDSLPQVLLMENVPQVHGKKNIEDFNKWINSLEEMGYKNYWQDLIATDYGVPQTRKRTFMVSILGDETYEFPKPFPLETKLKDLLEDNVDESFYLSDKQIEDVSHWNVYQKPLETMEKVDKENVSPTLTTRTGAYAAGMILVKDEYVGTYDYAQSDTLRPSEETRTHIGKETSGSLLASGNHNGLLIKNNTKKGYLEANEGDGVNICGRMKYQRGNVQKDMCQTLDTMGGDTKGVVVSNLKREMCNKLLQDGTVKENDVIRHSYTNSRMNGEMKDQKANNIAPILDTRCDCLGVVNNLRIRKLTPKECGRLMGVKDEDIDKMLINQSNASAYHIYGDGIVVNVLMEIFKEML